MLCSSMRTFLGGGEASIRCCRLLTTISLWHACILLLAGFQKAILFSLQSILDIPAEITFYFVRWLTITIVTRFGHACGY